MSDTPFNIHNFKTCKPVRKATREEVEQIIEAPTARRYLADGTFLPLYHGQEVSDMKNWLDRQNGGVR